MLHIKMHIAMELMCDIVGNKRVKSVECGLVCLQALVEGQQRRRGPTGQQVRQGLRTAASIAARVIPRLIGG